MYLVLADNIRNYYLHQRNLRSLQPHHLTHTRPAMFLNQIKKVLHIQKSNNNLLKQKILKT